MIVKVILLVTVILKTSRCSLIIDNEYQKGLYLSDYCPNMKYCKEGTHVMCMFYDPNNEVGPRCYNAVNISITADLAHHLLDVMNSIRSKVANGKETGKGGELLPRGYGIFRLKWDSELATFAQVLANQCVLRHDLCRATQRFTNPSQLIGLVRFTFPDWQLVGQRNKISSPQGVTTAKLTHAITQSLKSWYQVKSTVTEQLVKDYPDWKAPLISQEPRLYLEMIHGPTTHMGCGISGYSEYVYNGGRWQGIQNSVQVICNLSAEARTGTSSYETKPPKPGQGFSPKCGCPPGSMEDSDCLCNEVMPPPRSRPEPTCPVSEPSGNTCDPTLVLLPIFTMEDAPPDKLYKFAEEIKDPLKNFILQRIDNTSDNIEREGSFRHQRARPSAEMFDFMHAKEGEDVVWQRARNPSSPQSPAPSYNKIDNTSDTKEIQGSIKHERARSSSSAEMFDFLHAKEGGESFIEKDILWQRARNPSPPQSPAPSYNKIDNTSENTIERQDNFKRVRARSSKELFDFLHAKEREGVLWQRGRNPFSPQSLATSYKIDNTSDTIERQGSIKHERARSVSEMIDFIKAKDDNLWQRERNPFSPQSPAPTFKNLHREKQAAPVFRFGLSSKPPPPPPRKSPTLRPSPPARPLRTRPPPPPPPPPPRKPPPPPPVIHERTSTQKAPRPAASAAVRLQDRRKRPVPKLPPTHRLNSKKGSIFTKVAQFQLPKRRSMPTPSKVIKKDVAPRKDFSNLSKVVHDYLKSRPGYKIFSDTHKQNKPKEESKPPTEVRSQTEAVITDSGLNNAEETVINFNEYLNPKNNSNYNDKDVDIKDDNDNKLLTLLDTLEQEVKHIALDGSEKELFDAKIRKIYGSIVGKAALLKFPKPILLSTADTEAPEIDFGGAKVNDMLEPDTDEDNHVTVTEEPKQRSRYKVDQRIGRVKNYNPSIQGHKWKNKFIDSFDQKRYKDNMDVISYGDGKPPSDSYDHKYKVNFDHQYGDIDHKHMDELDRKYNEDINKKYSENHLDHEYKLSDNFHHQHNYDLEKKYEDNEPASRSKTKYEADRAVFREFGHNSLDTQEDTTPENYRYKDKKANHVTPEIPMIAKDREKRKKTERKHRKRIKSLNKHNGNNDPLSLERRKYYQDKLDNIRKKLRGRKNRSKNDSKNERSLRRMHTKNRENSRSRSKSPANNFYMPERAKFLHGF